LTGKELGIAFASAHHAQRRGDATRHPFLSQAGGEDCSEVQKAVHEYYKQLPLSESRGNIALRVDRELSSTNIDSPVQLSLHAARDIPAGTVVCHYGGMPVFERSLHISVPAEVDIKSHARRLPGSGFVLDGLPYSWMITRPIPRTIEQLNRFVASGPAALLPTPASTRFTSVELEWFNTTPMGFMANTAVAVNTKIAYVKLDTAVETLQLPVLVAVRDISQGEEILSPYNNGM
jgi:hypothetical protein